MIRAFAKTDTERLVEVWYRASLIAHPFLDDAFIAAERREITERWLPIAETNVYETDGRVVGFVSLIDNEVGGLFVDPDHQRRGIGRALLDHARESRSFLELDVFEANTVARRFYDKYGFRQVARHIHDKTGHPELRLRLG